jgi:hypothetical protein
MTINHGKRKRFSVFAFVLLAAFGLIAGQAMTNSAFAQQQGATNETVAGMRETQQAAVQHTTEDQRIAGNTQYTSRWSPAVTAPDGTLTAVFADCKPGEYASSEQHLFEDRDLELVHSLSVSLPDNYMTWLGIVSNEGNEPATVSIGVICADDADGAGDTGGYDLDYSTRYTINNGVNEIIRSQGNINLQYITLVYQKITQNAVQIVNITGNNNTVNQIINQTASQIIATNATTPEQINQIVNQTAQQQGVIIGSNNNLNQNATQNAGQQAGFQAPPSTDGTGAGGVANATTGDVSQSQTTEQQQQQPAPSTTDEDDEPVIIVPPPAATPPPPDEEEEDTAAPDEEEEDTTPNEEEEEEDTDATTADGDGNDEDGGDEEGVEG